MTGGRLPTVSPVGFRHCEARFGLDEKGEEIEETAYLWSLANLHYYDNVEMATDFLFEHGVRA
jgi:hypothetical protein